MIGNTHRRQLDEALAGCSTVVGTSARSHAAVADARPRECGLKSVAEAAANTPVALVFGRERVGDQ